MCYIAGLINFFFFFFFDFGLKFILIKFQVKTRVQSLVTQQWQLPLDIYLY